MIMAKDGEVALSFQPWMEVRRSFLWGLIKATWPIPWSRPPRGSWRRLHRASCGAMIPPAA